MRRTPGVVEKLGRNARNVTEMKLSLSHSSRVYPISLIWLKRAVKNPILRE
jgi:hypothetical protein